MAFTYKEIEDKHCLFYINLEQKIMGLNKEHFNEHKNESDYKPKIDVMLVPKLVLLGTYDTQEEFQQAFGMVNEQEFIPFLSLEEQLINNTDDNTDADSIAKEAFKADIAENEKIVRKVPTLSTDYA